MQLPSGNTYVYGLVLFGAFALGCAASSIVIPAARAGANHNKWEYLCIPGQQTTQGKMNAAGAEGWELVTAATGANTSRYCFKRSR